jgi:hypothetical protein
MKLWQSRRVVVARWKVLNSVWPEVDGEWGGPQRMAYSWLTLESQSDGANYIQPVKVLTLPIPCLLVYKLAELSWK